MHIKNYQPKNVRAWCFICLNKKSWRAHKLTKMCDACRRYVHKKLTKRWGYTHKGKYIWLHTCTQIRTFKLIKTTHSIQKRVYKNFLGRLTALHKQLEIFHDLIMFVLFCNSVLSTSFPKNATNHNLIPNWFWLWIYNQKMFFLDSY